MGTRVWNRNHIQPIDSFEVAWIAREHRQAMRQGSCRNHRVVRARSCLATGSTQRVRHSSKHSGRRRVQRQRFEVRFSLLKVRLPGCSIRIITRHKRTN